MPSRRISRKAGTRVPGLGAMAPAPSAGPVVARASRAGSATASTRRAGTAAEQPRRRETLAIDGVIDPVRVMPASLTPRPGGSRRRWRCRCRSGRGWSSRPAMSASRRLRRLAEQRGRGHHLAGLAVAALRHLRRHPGLDHLLADRVLLDRLDGLDLRPGRRCRRRAGRSASPARPSCTVQAPHCAMPQPYLVPVMPSVSRSTHSSGVSGSTSTWCAGR